MEKQSPTIDIPVTDKSNQEFLFNWRAMYGVKSFEAKQVVRTEGAEGECTGSTLIKGYLVPIYLITS